MTPKLPVVYLPGIDGTGRLLYRQERLLADFDVKCLSYPQDDKHTYSDLVALGVEALEATGPGVVVAESFGGAVALLVALQRPDLVRRLVLVNTFARYPRRLFIDVAGLVGPCSAWPSRSVAQISPSTVSSAMTSVSVGPANRSMPTRP